MALTLATNVSDGTITSSPGPKPATTHMRWRPTVQLATASAWRAPVYAASCASSSSVCGPMLSQPDR